MSSQSRTGIKYPKVVKIFLFLAVLRVFDDVIKALK